MTLSSITLITVIALLAVAFWLKLRSRSKKTSADDTTLVNEQIYVGNLPYRTDEDDLHQYFSRFGKVDSIRVIRNFKTGDSKGYAFVTFKTPADANAALVTNGKKIQGRAMVVRIAKPRQPHAPLQAS